MTAFLTSKISDNPPISPKSAYVIPDYEEDINKYLDICDDDNFDESDIIDDLHSLEEDGPDKDFEKTHTLCAAFTVVSLGRIFEL